MTQDLAVVAAGVVGFALSNSLSVPELDQWGWRLAFLIGAAVIPFGLREGSLSHNGSKGGTKPQTTSQLPDFCRGSITARHLFS